ncbi:tape measure protein [Nostoc sp. CHAB 5844]|nr:tape measure protein [Nostoc sp. CHAB 5844]
MSSAGSISLELKLSRAKFDQDLAKLQQEKFAIPVKLSLDTKDFNRQIKGLTEALPVVSIPIKLDTRQLNTAIASIKNIEVKAHVDLDADIKGFKNKLKDLKTSDLLSESQLKVSVQTDSRNGTEQVKILQQVRKTLDNIEKNTKRAGVIGKVADGFLYGAAGSAGLRFGGGVQSSLKQNFGLDFAKLGQKSANVLSVPVKFFTENEQLKTVFAKIGGDLGKSLKQAGYRFGDAIVASLEVNEGNILDRIGAFNKELFNPQEIVKNLQKALNYSKSASSDVVGALFSEDVLRKATEPYGKTLSAYRTQALKDRAIPLVQQRAAEISQNKSVNSGARAVKADTEEILIVTGGYAGARGLSGKSLLSGQGRSSPGINEDIKGRNAAAIWVRNTDSDLPQQSMRDAGKKAQALFTSIAKPIFRGFSKDAVEMAAQALSAIEINPKIKIKFIGESGGGFVAEEAAKILELMGAKDNVEYLGVGTPNLIGGLNAKGQKIISPDEILGAEASSLYTRLGLANTRTPSQQILGVEGHPYDNYRNAGIAEVMNSLQGAPQQFNRKDIKDARAAANSFKSEDLSKLNLHQLEGFARMAFANLQNVRRQILIASLDTKAELEEIAQIFEQVFVRASPESSGITKAREVLTKAQEIYQALDEQRGTEAGLAAQKLLQELQIHEKEFLAAYEGAVGTTKAKVESLSEMYQDLAEKLSDPSLSLKGSKPAPIKQPIAPASDQQVSAIKNLGQTYSNTAKTLPLQDDVTTKQLAADIRRSADESRKAIADLVAAFGTNAPQFVKQAAKTARQQITRAEKKSQQYFKEGEELGKNVGAGLDQGIQDAIALVRKSASELANNLINQTKDDLEIHSPSKVFEQIGKFISQGLAIGLDGADAAKDFTAGLVDESQKGASLMSKAFNSLKGVIGGFLVVQALGYAQSLLSDLVKDATQAYIELDRLKTALNFASGGSAGGAQNLAFVRKTVEDLKVPLKASTEGFVQLGAAAKGSALEGKETRELFTGISQASTVLSLSADDTKGAILALSQMISKGKVSAEELRQQLGERLPGAMGIAARALGVTETEFQRLLDSGQILSQDFLPKFAKQLQSEFGDAAKEASGNAQSAVFNLENSFLSLQQAVGEATAPGAAAGMNLLAEAMKLATKFGTELALIFSSLNIALAAQSLPLFKDLLFTLFKTKSIPGIFSAIKTGAIKAGNALNNSFSAKVGLAVFGVLEIVNLLNQQVNTDLVKGFEKAAEAAQEAADASERAFEKSRNRGGKNAPTPAFEPQASSGVGQTVDNFLIKPLRPLRTVSANPLSNLALAAIPGIGIPLSKIGSMQTTGEYERDENLRNFANQLSASRKLGATVSVNFAELQKGSGAAKDFISIDKQLQQAEQQRRILQGRIEREYSQKGLPVPIDITFELNQANKNIAELNEKRANLSKPYTDDLIKVERDINNLKASLKNLDTPEAIKNLGEDEIAQQKSLYEQTIQLQEKIKAKAENVAAAMRADPIRAFTQALRELNLALAEGQEKNEQKLADRKLANTRKAIAGFSTNKLAARQLALSNANDEREIAADNADKQQAIVAGLEAEVNRPEFQPTLKRLGVAPDSSAAKIDDVLKNTSDDADKGVLEKLKAFAESRLKLSQTKQVADDAKQRFDQQVQDNAFFTIEDSAANSRARTTQTENQNIAKIRNAQAARLLTEEAANEKISRIQLQSTRSQQKNIDQQLASLRIYHQQGAISAEKFAEKERELTTEQTNLERTEAENRLAIQQAVTQRRLKDIEFANKKAESAIALTQTNATRQAKEKLLAAGLTPQAQDQFSRELNAIDQNTTTDNIALIKKKIAQNQESRKKGDIDPKQAAEIQMSLNQELAKAQEQLVDQKIAGEEKYREVVERNVQRIMQAEDNRFKSLTSQLEYQKAGLELYSASLERTKTLEESRYNLSKALSDAAISPLETKRDNANRALELSRRLKDDNLDPTVKSAITSQLGAMGFGTDELQILQQRSQIEDEIAAKKLEALKLEQAYQRQALQLDLKRQKIAAETALYDAQSAQLSAAKSKLDAEAALRIAQAKKDPAAIDAAKTGIEIANREIDLSNKRLDNALANLGAQDELARNATLTQEATQRSAIDQQLAADGARKQASALERVESSVKRTSETQHSALSTQHSNEGWENPFIQKKGEGMFDYSKRIHDAKMFGQIVETNNRTWSASDEVVATKVISPQVVKTNVVGSNVVGSGVPPIQSADSTEKPKELELTQIKPEPGENLFDTYQRQRDELSLMPKKLELTPVDQASRNKQLEITQIKPKPGENLFEAYQRQRDELYNMPPIDQTASKVDAAKITPPEQSGGYAQFAEALKIANQDVVQRLDKLVDSMATVAASPRSLTVSTPNPVDDAADIMNKISRQGVRGSGL